MRCRNKAKHIKFIIIYLLSLMSGNLSFASNEQDPWQAYLDGSVGKNIYYLYNLVKSHSFSNNLHRRALNLGSGAGDVDFDLASQGWDITSVDTSPRAGEIISERIKYINGKFQFQLSNFDNIVLNGNYNLVLSFFALPFGNKNGLPEIVSKISQHTQSGSIFAVNFFGYNHSFVKQGHAYGISKTELNELLNSYGFEVQYFLNRQYKQSGNDGEPLDWDVLDVIAIKR